MSLRMFVAILALPVSVWASDYHSPRTAALGGAGRGGPLLTDAIFLNPAMNSFLPSYQINGSFNSYHGKEDSEPKGRVLHYSIQDGRNQLFQAGLAYTKRADGSFVHLGVSKALAQKFGMGLGSKYAFSSAHREKAFDGTFGMIASPIDWLQGSLVVDNVFENTKGKAWGLYREFALGIKFNVKGLLLAYVDPHYVPNKPGSAFGYEAGIEIPLFRDLFIRAGKSENSMQPHIATYGDGYGMGFGWIFPRLSIDAAFSRTVNPVQTDNRMISFTISY